MKVPGRLNVEPITGGNEARARRHLRAAGHVVEGVDALAGRWIEQLDGRPQPEDAVEDGPEAVGRLQVAMPCLRDGGVDAQLKGVGAGQPAALLLAQAA